MGGLNLLAPVNASLKICSGFAQISQIVFLDSPYFLGTSGCFVPPLISATISNFCDSKASTAHNRAAHHTGKARSDTLVNGVHSQVMVHGSRRKKNVHGG